MRELIDIFDEFLGYYNITQIIGYWFVIYKKCGDVLPDYIPMEIEIQDTDTSKNIIWYSIYVGQDDFGFGCPLKVSNTDKEVGEWDMDLDSIDKMVDVILPNTFQELSRYITNVYNQTKDDLGEFLKMNKV